jgi:hypothetical protein
LVYKGLRGTIAAVPVMVSRLIKLLKVSREGKLCLQSLGDKDLTIFQEICSGAYGFVSEDDIETLLSFGGDRYFTAMINIPAWHYCLSSGQPHILKALLKDFDASKINQISMESNNALHWAIRGARDEETALDFIKQIVDKGFVDINESNEDSETPAYMAAKKDYSKIFKYLIDAFKNIDLDIESEDGSTARTIAIDSQLYSGILPGPNPRGGPDEFLDRKDEKGFINFMIKNPIYSVNGYYNKEGLTYFQFCCWYDWMDAAKFLLERDVDASAEHMVRILPISLTVCADNYEMFKYLLDRIPLSVLLGNKDYENLFTETLLAVTGSEENQIKYFDAMILKYDKSDIDITKLQRIIGGSLQFAYDKKKSYVVTKLLERGASFSCWKTLKVKVYRIVKRFDDMTAVSMDSTLRKILSKKD